MSNNYNPQTVEEAFPKLWLNAEDLKNAVEVMINAVSPVEVYDRISRKSVNKVAVAFSHNDRVLSKRLILNVTQAESFAGICGSGTFRDWPGHMVRLSVAAAPNGKATIAVTRPASPAPVAVPAKRPHNEQVEAAEAADRAAIAADLERGDGNGADLAAIAAGKEERDAEEAGNA